MRKLIYGYLNELTMDLNKVVYFGKEDRKNDKFNRFNEHRKEGSKHYNELIKMKYILFSFIPQSLSLSDAEAFYIQEYNPELNIMGNPYNGMTEKLSNEEMKTMRKALKDTKWYLIKNIEYPLSTCYIWNEKAVGDVIKEIEQREKRLREAAYVFKSKEEIAEMKFSEIIKLYEKGELFIEPRITLTLEEKLLRVIPQENSIGEQWVEIEEDGYSNQVEHIYFKKIELYHINELQYDLEQAKVECINKEKNVVEEQVKKEICKKLFCFWIYRLYLAAKSVKATEPDFIKGLKFIDLEGKDVLELATTYNNGFNIRNFYQISKLRILYQLKENEEVRLIGGSIRGENKSIHNMVPEGMKEMYERIRKTEIEEFIKLYEEELIYDMDSCLGDGWLYEDEKGRMYLTNCYREGGRIVYKS